MKIEKGIYLSFLLALFLGNGKQGNDGHGGKTRLKKQRKRDPSHGTYCSFFTNLTRELHPLSDEFKEFIPSATTEKL